MTGTDADVPEPTHAFNALIRVVKVGDIIMLRRINDRTDRRVEIRQSSQAGLVVVSSEGMEWVAGWEVQTWKAPMLDHDPAALVQHDQTAAHDHPSAVTAPMPTAPHRTQNEPPIEDRVATKIAQCRSECSGEPAIDHPEPSFEIANLGWSHLQEINRWRQRYIFARNSNDLTRLAAHVAEIEGLAESLSNPQLFCLAGAFAHLGGSGARRAKALYDISAARGWRPACIALASLRLAERDFFGAAEALISAVLGDSSALDNYGYLTTIGRCLIRSGWRPLPGLGDLMERSKDEPTRHLAARLAATALESDVAASLYAIRLDTRALRETNAGSTLFRCASTDEPVTAGEADGYRLQTVQMGPRRGKISAFYSERNYGFLVDDTAGDTWFFHASEVRDGGLLDDLNRGLVRQLVVFEGEPTALTGKYPAASQVRSIADAVRREGSLQASPAASQLRSVAGASTPNAERESRAPLSVRLAVMPKSKGAYATAKHAEQLDQLERAKEFFREEIEARGPYLKSAIKDLAMLLNRQGHSEEALALLERHRQEYAPSELSSLDHLAVVCLIKARRFVTAAERLAVLAHKENRQHRKLDLMRQEAYWLFAAGHIDSSLKKLHALLRSHPTDTATRQLIDKVTQAHASSQLQPDARSLADKATEGDDLADKATEGDDLLSILTPKLSQLARRHLDRCGFHGVDQRAKDRAHFTVRDFKTVDHLHRQLAGRFPRERAEYCLTLAALCEQRPDIAGARTLHLYLSRHFVAATETAMIAHAPSDVARCYATEALVLLHDNERPEEAEVLEDALVLLLGTYLSPVVEPTELLSAKRGERLPDACRRFNTQPGSWSAFLADVAHYHSMFPSAMSTLSASVVDHVVPRIEEDIAQERTRRRSVVHLLRRFLDASAPLTADRLRGYCRALDAELASVRFELDRDRLSHLSQLCSDGADYVLERHFRERENRFLRLESDLANEIDEYTKNPTQLSVEALVPALTAFRAALDADFTRTQATPPDLSLSNVLDNDYYVVNAGAVALRLLLRSHDERSPAIESISLLSDHSDPCHSPDPLYGGDSRELELIVRPSAQEIADSAFTVKVDVTFRVRGGEERTVELPGLAVRLGGVEFQQIPNPYAKYAGGVPIGDGKMFFGRSELIRRITSYLSDATAGQCYVLYGQKRSGKSSVLKRIEHTLPPHVVYLSLSVGALNRNDVLGSFARVVVQGLEAWSSDRKQLLGSSLPSRDDAQAQPVEALIDASRLLSERGLRLLLAVDEFTYMYDGGTDHQDSTGCFMRGWKALLEANAFNALVIGQDTMPRFKQTYPNEFGVTHDERISYLDSDETRSLASEPILLDGLSRYRGKSIDRLFELTAGSPYFLQIMLDRLVSHLNLRQASFVTEADIDHVARGLCLGGDKLTPERFDALVTAASERASPVPHDALWAVVERVARESLHAGWCSRESLRDLPKHQACVDDLVAREILDREGGRVRLRVGLFAMWLRSNPSHQ